MIELNRFWGFEIIRPLAIRSRAHALIARNSAPRRSRGTLVADASTPRGALDHVPEARQSPWHGVALVLVSVITDPYGRPFSSFQALDFRGGHGRGDVPLWSDLLRFTLVGYVLALDPASTCSGHSAGPTALPPPRW